MHVTLKTSNASNYFNVIAPDAGEALFVGSASGGEFTGALPASGDYTIRVYLMRNAARRNEAGNYTLTVQIVGAQGAHTNAANDSVSPGNRAAYCRGKVAESYGTRPAYVMTNPPQVTSGGGSSITGTVDKGSEGIKRFSCRFDSAGRFVDVMALTSDGE
jgi:hypothetical protein